MPTTTKETLSANQILAALKKLGKPQTAAIYRRHGAGGDVCGVLTSELVKFKKKIKVDHDLAKELRRTGNAEARILALQICDAQRLTLEDANRFVQDGPMPFISCYLCDLLARSPIAEETMRLWMRSADESRRQLGYGILSVRLKDDANSISDSDARAVLATIEKEIHSSANRARYAMNGAVISIGVFKPALRKEALQAAKRIGKVAVDHGETGCRTPDAASYIESASNRKRCS